MRKRRVFDHGTVHCQTRQDRSSRMKVTEQTNRVIGTEMIHKDRRPPESLSHPAEYQKTNKTPELLARSTSHLRAASRYFEIQKIWQVKHSRTTSMPSAQTAIFRVKFPQIAVFNGKVRSLPTKAVSIGPSEPAASKGTSAIRALRAIPGLEGCENTLAARGVQSQKLVSLHVAATV